MGMSRWIIAALTGPDWWVGVFLLCFVLLCVVLHWWQKWRERRRAPTFVLPMRCLQYHTRLSKENWKRFEEECAKVGIRAWRKETDDERGARATTTNRAVSYSIPSKANQPYGEVWRRNG